MPRPRAGARDPRSQADPVTATAPRSGIQDLVQKTSVLEIVGDMIRVRTMGAALGDLAVGGGRGGSPN